MQLQDRCILLTGATGGIGRAAALQLAARGAKLWLSGRREGELQELAAQIRREGGRAEVLVADLTERGAARDLIARLRSVEPRLDIVINCAGAMHFGYFESTPPEAIEQLWRTNVLAPMQLVQAAVPALRQGGVSSSTSAPSSAPSPFPASQLIPAPSSPCAASRRLCVVSSPAAESTFCTLRRATRVQRLTAARSATWLVPWA